MKNAISLRGVRKTFGPKVAVENLDLSIETGAVIGLIGPNGAGKTTTIRIIMSILFPDSGSVEVLGKASAVESKDRIGYLPEERGLYKKMRVGAFLKYMASLKGVEAPEAKVKQWLARVGLEETYRKRCDELSKGMQQKVQFIAAIIHQPDLLILDEPFSGLDPVNSRMLRELFEEQHQRGCTVIFSTHQMSQAEALCDRVVMIHQGRKVLDNTPREIRDRFDPHAILLEPLDEHDARIDSLEQLPEISRIERDNGSVHIYARPGADPSSLLARIAAAVPANCVQLLRPTLEDIFVDIVEPAVGSEDERNQLNQLRRGVATGRSDRGGD
ncbi:MAG TPA: ATP-binding cassette domain-containing protein [Phycisphaerales bacterium]|nr:ATP-binding cassette domain-containing protein [Phycisphaerales bacterium]